MGERRWREVKLLESYGVDVKPCFVIGDSKLTRVYMIYTAEEVDLGGRIMVCGAAEQWGSRAVEQQSSGAVEQRGRDKIIWQQNQESRTARFLRADLW